MKRSAWIGRAARERIRRGGPRAMGRPAASVGEWKVIKAAVLARAGWHCQACGLRGRLDVHHVVKRSQGGSDFDLDRLVALCRWCHDQTDAPYERGRLVVTALGDDQFRFDVIRRGARGSVPVSAKMLIPAYMDEKVSVQRRNRIQPVRSEKGRRVTDSAWLS